MNQHHVITDGYSGVILHKELEALYSQLIGSQPGALNALDLPAPATFAEFIDQTHNYQLSEKAQQDEAFWIQHFSTPVAPRRYYGHIAWQQDHLTRYVTALLDPNLTNKINALTATLPAFLLFMATMFAFVRRVTVSNDICLGMPVHNRAPEFRGTAGLIFEVCPIRATIDAHETFNTLLAKLRVELDAVKPHQRHFVRPQLCTIDAFLSYQPRSPTKFAGYPAIYDRPRPASLFDATDLGDAPRFQSLQREVLSVNVYRKEGCPEFGVGMEFNRAIWPERSDGERSLGHFLKVLEALLDNPDREIDSIDVLTDKERTLLLPLNDNTLSVRAKLPTVLALFREQAIRRPDHPAIIFEKEVVSYAQLNARVRMLARRLSDLGVGSDALVGVWLERSPDMIVALLAIMDAGGIYMPLDPRHPPARIDAILGDAHPALILTQSSLKETGSQRWRNSMVCLDVEPIAENLIAPIQEGNRASELAYVIFTSGSTGRPKGVEVTHRALSSLLFAMSNEPGINEDDRVLAVTTLSFDIAALELFLPLIAGATVHIASAEVVRNAHALAEQLDGHGITLFQATPATFRMLVAGGWKGNSNLKILCGGEALPEDLARQLLKRSGSLWNMYGPTETTIWSTTKKIAPGQPITIGHPIPGTSVFVLNENLSPVPLGVEGELFISGDGLARGYFRRDELTRERFLPNPFSRAPGAQMYRTGDMVRMHPNRELEYLGRRDLQVKLHGFRIELQEIELVLNDHEAVLHSLVNVVGDDDKKMLVAYVVPRITHELNRDDIHRFLRARLPDYMLPSAIMPMTAFPLTPSGKVDRGSLPSPDEADRAIKPNSYVAPRNDLEIAMAAAWEKVLGIQRVGINVNFFELGGDSLRALSLVLEMQETTGIEMDLGEVFRSPTIAELVVNIGAQAAKSASMVVPLQTEGDGISIFCLYGIHLFKEFAESLGKDQPVYGVYVAAEGLLIDQTSSGSALHMSTDRLVAAYYEAILRFCPNGPYRLAGSSFGGLVAILVAAEMRRHGAEVDLVMLFDTILPKARHRNWTKWISNKTAAIVNGITKQTLRERLTGVKNALQKGRAKNETQESADRAAQIFAFRRSVFLQALKAWQAHAVIFDFRVILFQGMDRSWLGSHTVLDNDYGWRRYLKERLILIAVPGNHWSILKSPTVTELGRLTKPYLMSELNS